MVFDLLSQSFHNFHRRQSREWSLLIKDTEPMVASDPFFFVLLQLRNFKKEAHQNYSNTLFLFENRVFSFSSSLFPLLHRNIIKVHFLASCSYRTQMHTHPKTPSVPRTGFLLTLVWFPVTGMHYYAVRVPLYFLSFLLSAHDA